VPESQSPKMSSRRMSFSPARNSLTRSPRMSNDRATNLRRALTLLAGLLILKVTATVVLGYRNYLPPDFNSDFLRGREGYFFGGYQIAFYAHIASGPLALIAGTLLVSDSFRQRFRQWHRLLGRFQIANILLFVAPSGLWMARYAAAGPVAGVGFALLALLTGMCAALGFRTAVQRRFPVHRRWMWRSYLLLCSAVVLRLLGGLAIVVGIQAAWFDPVASWASWTVPLAIFEFNRLRNAWSVPLSARPAARSAAIVTAR
jgi:Predicted membrane protein (DUF2306)